MADASPSSLFPLFPRRYEIILNEDGAVVGQVISDGVAVTLTDASKSLLAPVELCVATRADIPTDAEKYNLSDFVTYNVSSEELSPPLHANVTVHDGEYCLKVNDSQTYVAILRSEMALRTYDLLFDSTCQPAASSRHL